MSISELTFYVLPQQSEEAQSIKKFATQTLIYFTFFRARLSISISALFSDKHNHGICRNDVPALRLKNFFHSQFHNISFVSIRSVKQPRP